LPKAEKLNPKTIWAIRGYVQRGYSANKIQEKLKAQHLGIRRKELLAEVRRAKNQPKKPNTVKYIPKKYARPARWRGKARVKALPRKRLRWLGEKQVTLVGKHKGKLVIEKKRGSGKELYRFIKDEMTGDYWDEKPHIHS
jgi:hypothetical protein